MSTLVRLLAALGVLAAAVIGAHGCDSAPCMEAADAMDACLARLDCRDADPTEISRCNTAKTKGQDAVNQLRSLPCTATVRDTADTINACPVDQIPFCNCFQ